LQVRDYGANALGECASLEYLSLRYVRVGDATAKALGRCGVDKE